MVLFSDMCVYNSFDDISGLSKDREVVLEASHIRVGSLKAAATGVVRVRNDTKENGISFKIKCMY